VVERTRRRFASGRRGLLAAAASVAVTGGACGQLQSEQGSVPASAAGPATSSLLPSGSPGGLFSAVAAERSRTGTAPMVSSPLLVPVPPLPGDLRDASRPRSPPTGDRASDHGDGELSPAGEVAAAWVATVYTARYDDPRGTAAKFIAPLAATAAVASAAETSLPPTSDAGEARWPVITAVTATGDGWWRVEALVKTTRFGQSGPATTAAVLRVHVTGELLVDRWTVVEQ
jgi:hypothetical protein